MASGAAIADSGAVTATNINLTSGGTVTLSGTTNGATNVNTIRQGSATAATINVGTGGVVRLGVNGGILQSVNVANSGGASLTIGTGTGAGGGILTAGGNTLGTAGEITISQVASGINNQIVINSVVANNNASSGAANSTGGGAVTLTINAPAEGTNGTSALVLNGANTYSGGTYINDGRVGTGNNSAFGTGNVYLLQGSQVIASSNTFANNFFLAGGGADSGGFVSLRGGSYNGVITLMGDARIGGGATFNGQITGGYNLEFNNGTQTLANTAGTNNWTGNTLLSGNLNLGASNHLPDGSAAGNVTINNGVTFDLKGFSDTINGLTATATAGQGIVQTSATTGTSVFTVGGNDQTSTFNGGLRETSTGKLQLVKTGVGQLTLGNTTTTTTNSNYSGGTVINNGTLRFATAAMMGTPLGSVNGSLTVNGGATAGTLDLNGNSLTVGSLAGASSTASGLITSTGTGALILTVNNNSGTGGAGTNTVYAGTLQNGSATSLGLTLASTNTETLSLTGTNTYTGATMVNGGTLLFNGNSGGATGAVSVASGGTLGGNGSLGGAATIDGTVAPGSATGTVGILNLTSASGANIRGTGIDLADLNATTSDNLTLTGTLTIASGATLTFNTLATPTVASYVLAIYRSVMGTFNVKNLPSGYTLSYGGTELDLVAVPEPATWLGGALSLGALGCRLRRRVAGMFKRPSAA